MVVAEVVGGGGQADVVAGGQVDTTGEAQRPPVPLLHVGAHLQQSLVVLNGDGGSAVDGIANGRVAARQLRHLVLRVLRASVVSTVSVAVAVGIVRAIVGQRRNEGVLVVAVKLVRIRVQKNAQSGEVVRVAVDVP